MQILFKATVVVNVSLFVDHDEIVLRSIIEIMCVLLLCFSVEQRIEW